ncbi:hypothetical protein GCM10010232_17230 [Streptomyces amakusaensis]
MSTQTDSRIAFSYEWTGSLRSGPGAACAPGGERSMDIRAAEAAATSDLYVKRVTRAPIGMGGPYSPVVTRRQGAGGARCPAGRAARDGS